MLIDGAGSVGIVARVTAFTYLLASGQIGGLELPNRIVMPAMDMNQSEEGHVTDAEIDHYRARAAGGVGLIIMGTGAVAWPVGATSRHQPAFSHDKYLPGLSRLADTIHAAGGRICAQLCHHGKTAGIDTAEGRPLLVPSLPEGPAMDLSVLRDNTPEELGRLGTATAGRAPTFREATEDDLAWVIDQFAEAAARVQRAGIDAVEIHAAHGYLLSTFLSGAYNRRGDQWGGDIEGRARLTCQVIRSLRDRVGPSYPILVRINGHEFGPTGSVTAADAASASRLFEAAGADAIHVSASAHDAFKDFTEGPLPSEVGQYRNLARAVKTAVNIPVIAVGRVLPELAEEMLAAGESDYVAMGRQLLTDPDLPVKIRSGHRASVRPCINCYVCVEQNFFDATPRCAVNPALGNEGLAATTAAPTRHHVVVVGGGPAGLEATRRARLAGHRVTLLERGRRLGGTAWLSQLTTPANGELVRWLEHEVEASGAEIRLSAEATIEKVLSLKPDVVLVATGALRPRPQIPGGHLPHVQTGNELRGLLSGDGIRHRKRPARLVLAAGRLLGITEDAARIRKMSRRWMPIGPDVVIAGGSLVGLELAEFLAERGRRVTLVEPGPAVGLPMAMPRRWAMVRRATEHSVEVLRSATLVEIRPSEVVVRLADGSEQTRPATDVISAAVTAGETLAEELQAAGIEVRAIGDAASVGYIEGAIHSAWAAVAAL